MKYTVYVLLLMMVIGCNKIELPDDETETSNPSVNPEELGETISVLEALTTDIPKDICVHGYIVGYVIGNSMKRGATFDIPYEAQNTNFLLADSPSEKDYQNCIAVKLEKSGNNATRNELNLLDHPEYLKKSIEIVGYLSKYFSKNGITKVFAYEFKALEGDDSNLENSDSISTPDIQDEEEYIPDGRTIRI